MGEFMIFEYSNCQKNYSITILKDEIKQHMAYLTIAFASNNDIAKKMLNIIPDCIWMKIDNDFNMTQDVPVLLYQTEVDGKIQVLKIRRNHKIIWGFLEYYCQKAEQE